MTCQNDSDRQLWNCFVRGRPSNPLSRVSCPWRKSKVMIGLISCYVLEVPSFTMWS